MYNDPAQTCNIKPDRRIHLYTKVKRACQYEAQVRIAILVTYVLLKVFLIIQALVPNSISRV